VILAGVIGWYLSKLSPNQSPVHDTPDPEFSVWGQIFGYGCAVLYLFSRIPQILLNHRRKSCEGVSILFFLFAGIGNLTYVMSILAFTPDGTEWDGAKYGKYLAVNSSWLLGSVGTLVLDAVIFGQFFWYDREEETDEESDEGDVRNWRQEGIEEIGNGGNDHGYGSTSSNRD
jgi:hypothetical protein